MVIGCILRVERLIKMNLYPPSFFDLSKTDIKITLCPDLAEISPGIIHSSSDPSCNFTHNFVFVYVEELIDIPAVLPVTLPCKSVETLPCPPLPLIVVSECVLTSRTSPSIKRGTKVIPATVNSRLPFSLCSMDTKTSPLCLRLTREQQEHPQSQRRTRHSTANTARKNDHSREASKYNPLIIVANHAL